MGGSSIAPGRRAVTRRLAVAIVAAVLALAGAVPWVAPRPAAAAGLKVVLIVGPVESLTSTYRSYMDKVATTAASYGADVRKVYSPNATWTNVLNNIQGASIVVYMGHGNGFPSPYSSTLNPDKVDGLGLNDPNNLSDNAHIYYGESYIKSSVKLAPNAVVFLSHACYSAGSSESWDTDPTLGVAEQRVDNFAAGFLAAGARAVFALAHADPSPYVAKLFTSSSTMKTIFETASDYVGTYLTRFPSTRTPGFDAEVDPSLDPRQSPSLPDYYLRSLVTYPGLTSAQVRGYDPLAPKLSGFAPAPAYVSPNADAVKDTVTFTGTWSATTSWRVRIQKPDTTTLATKTGTGTALSATWAGDDGTSTVPNGAYRVVVDATDAGGHVSGPFLFTVTVDTVAPIEAAPPSRLYAGWKVSSSTDPVKTSWLATDAGGGIGYTLQRQTNGGSWTGISLSSSADTAIWQSLTSGTKYAYRVRATDGAGNASAFAIGPTIEPFLTQDTSSAVTYGGSWATVSNTSTSGGTYHRTGTAGAWASYAYTGISIGWVALKGPYGGSVDVYVDGAYKTTINLYASTTSWRLITYALNYSSQGSHTIKIVAKGNGNVYVDGFARLYRP